MNLAMERKSRRNSLQKDVKHLKVLIDIANGVLDNVLLSVHEKQSWRSRRDTWTQSHERLK